MGTQLHTLKDHESGRVEGYLDLATGTVFEDEGGLRLKAQLQPTEFLCGENEKPLRDDNGDLIHVGKLANVAAEHMYRKMRELIGRAPKVQTLDRAGRVMRDQYGRPVLMDLNVGDVHTPAAMPNYAAGYHLADGIADAASPVLLVQKQSDVYYTANSANDFLRKMPTGGAPGAGSGEVNPSYTASTYAVQQYTLSGFLPTEILSNADVPLKPLQKLTQMIVDAHRLERELRVVGLLQNSSNFNSNLVQTLTSGAQWDGGASSDPVANLHHAIESSFMNITGIFWSEQVLHDFQRNPAVQKYFQFKDRVNGLPKPEKLSEVLELPPIYTGTMKYSVGGAPTYAWGNHVVLIHQPAELPPTTQLDVATSETFRWTGGTAPDGTMTGGMLVRSYFDPKRGARGGNMVVVIMEDIELMTSGLVGGLILNAHQ